MGGEDWKRVARFREARGSYDTSPIEEGRVILEGLKWTTRERSLGRGRLPFSGLVTIEEIQGELRGSVG